MPWSATGRRLLEDGGVRLDEDGLSPRLVVREIPQPDAVGPLRRVTESGGARLFEDGNTHVVSGITAASVLIGPFHDHAVLPEVVAKATSLGPGFRNEVHEVAEGEFGRLMHWQRPLIRGDVLSTVQLAEDYGPLLSFVRSREGSRYGFRVLDANDHSTHHHHVGVPTASDYRHRHIIGAGDGSTFAFQLRKTYRSPIPSWGTAPAVERYRPISRPVQPNKPSHAMHIFVDGVEQTEGAGYTVDYSGGVVNFGTAPGKGSVIEWAGTFHTAMRFGIDLDQGMLADLGTGTSLDLPPLPVVEIGEQVVLSDHKWRGGFVQGATANKHQAITLSDGMVQFHAAGNSALFYTLPVADQFVDGGPHLLIYNSGANPFALRAADHTLVVTALAAGDWAQLSLRSDGTWLAHR